MGTKAFLQKGRGKPGLVLPANAVARINQANDRSALIRVAAVQERAADPLPVADDPPPPPKVEPTAAKSSATMTSSATLTVTAEASEPVETGTGAVPATMQPHPIERDPEPEPQADAISEPDDLTKIAGIGPALNQRLQKFGFKNYGDLANASAATLDEIQGVKGRGASIIESARKLSEG